MSFPEPGEFVTGSMSDIGKVRAVNQDYFGEFEDPQTRRRMLIIADGMGGHLGGEVASKLAVETVAAIFEAGGDDGGDLLRDALETANARVYQAAQADAGLAGMGTTGVCLLFEAGGRGWLGHVGDSRAYRLRAGQLDQITEDHSFVGALIRDGRITEDEAKLHPRRNEILRAIGTDDQVEVQLSPLELQPGDKYLLCSDGLSGLIAAADIADVLGRMQPQDAVRALVEMANQEGGNDNITAQVVMIPGEGSGEKEGAAGSAEGADPAGPSGWIWVAAAGLAGALLWLLLGSR
ncbi:MAG: Stp1/IreP family PP2C-type Ser/Thr phosphatase [Myxococcota bacterium]|nr:Stp1/IreP family PP2C-type Ser/Thr phosphatase [Myxococcota bacterium]